MGNLGGLGAFAQGLAGGIQQGAQNYATLKLKGMEMEQEKQKTEMQKTHMSLLNDANKFETLLKVIEKSPDLPATQEYIDKLGFEMPFYKDTASAMVIADASTKKELKDFTESITSLIKNPSSDTFNKVDFKLAEASARFGSNSNNFKSLKATADLLLSAHKKDDLMNLTRKIDKGMPLINQLKKANASGMGGLTQQKPNLTDEQLQVISATREAKDQMFVKYPEEYKIKAKEYGWDEPADSKQFAPQLTPYKNIKTGKIDYLDANKQEDIERIKSGAYTPYEKPNATVQVTIGGFTKATQTDLEKQQMDAEQNIMSFDEIEKLMKPEFLTFRGQGTALAQKYAEKLELGTSTKFLSKRTAWMQQAKSAFLAYRKWVTGVAGGEKEMAEIAKSFPDPEKNSPTEFASNLKQARTWRKKVLNWTKYTRSQGLSISETPENMKPTKQKTIQGGLESFTDEELLEMLERMQ